MHDLTIVDLRQAIVKSFAMTALSEAEIRPGRFEHDRWLMLIARPHSAPNWTFVAQRKAKQLGIPCPELAGFHATLYGTTLGVHHNHAQAEGELRTHGPLELLEAQLWKCTVEVYEPSHELTAWIRDRLHHEFIEHYEVKLVQLAREHTRHDETQRGMADRHSVHLISAASVRALAALSDVPIVEVADRFRANIIVDTDAPPFAEFQWRHCTIGRVPFRVVGPTERCAFVNLQQGAVDPQREPMKSLVKLHEKLQLRKPVCFGVHLVPTGSGVVTLHDTGVAS